MQGKTHFTVGMATALLATQPATISGILASIAAGGIGGKLPDVDLKTSDINCEEVYNSIIDLLFISTIILIDYFVGNGICQYIIDNWGPRIWAGLIGFIVLLIVSIISPHRSFTHSFIGIVLYGVAMYLFCKPIVLPFLVGYVSHIFLDLFNKKGMTLFFPFKHRFCLNMRDSKDKASEILYWIGLALTVITGAILLSSSFQKIGNSFANIDSIISFRFLGMNILQIYLIVLNIITFLGFQRSWYNSCREILAEKDKKVRIRLQFETWILNFLAIIGGGVGMMVALLIHGCFPCGYNGNWWAICYASILTWFTIYCYIVNPFLSALSSINLIESKHLIVFMYLAVINIISALLFWHYKKRHLNEYSLVHTLLWFIGALGGTIGAYPVVIATHRDRSYNYAVFGFPLMLASQILFIGYMMSAGIF